MIGTGTLLSLNNSQMSQLDGQLNAANQRANLFASTPLVELFFALGYGNFRGRCFRVVATALAFAL